MDSIGPTQQLCENMGLQEVLNETNITAEEKASVLNYGRTEQASVK